MEERKIEEIIEQCRDVLQGMPYMLCVRTGGSGTATAAEGPSAGAFGPVAQQFLTRVFHNLHTLPGHPEDTEFVYRAETVFDGPQQAVILLPVSFKVKDHVHHVLQHARAGNGAVLGNVSHKEDAGAGFLAQPHDQAGAFPDLADTAGSAGHFRTVHGLYTVDDRRVRLQLPDLFLNGVQGIFRQDIQVAFNAQPFRAELDLPGGFLAADIQRAFSAFGQMVADLEQQRALADAGVAADQDQAALHDTAAQNPVQLTDAGTGPYGDILRNIFQGKGLRAGARPLVRGELA